MFSDTYSSKMKEKFHGGLTSFNDFDLLLALISALILMKFLYCLSYMILRPR